MVVAGRALEMKDFLFRESYMQRLEKHVDALHNVPSAHLSTPRALAVDAPWGNGKSWVAHALQQRLLARQPPYRSVLIDAFKHDHQSDAFAVIASAIYKVLKPHGELKKTFIKATGEVLKAAAPTAAKAMMNLTLSTVGLDGDKVSDATKSAIEAAQEGASKFSAKGVEALLEGFTRNELAHENFMHALGNLTSDLERPLVVLIDELDRCRPSFALEILERIKHLFSVDKVVFILFWNSAALQETVRHTYGQGVDAERYLSKFTAYSIPLPVKGSGHSSDAETYEVFVDRVLHERFGSEGASHLGEFRRSLARFSKVLGASLRDAEKAIHMFRTLPSANRASQAEFAYLVLLKCISEIRFSLVAQMDPLACAAEAAKLGSIIDDRGNDPLRDVYMVLRYLADVDRFDEIHARGGTADSEEDAEVIQAVFLSRPPILNMFKSATSLLTADLSGS